MTVVNADLTLRGKIWAGDAKVGAPTLKVAISTLAVRELILKNEHTKWNDKGRNTGKYLNLLMRKGKIHKGDLGKGVSGRICHENISW